MRDNEVQSPCKKPGGAVNLQSSQTKSQIFLAVHGDRCENRMRSRNQIIVNLIERFRIAYICGKQQMANVKLVNTLPWEHAIYKIIFIFDWKTVSGKCRIIVVPW